MSVAQVSFLYAHLSWCVLWLLLTTMIGVGSFCVLVNVSHPGFSFLHTSLLMCSVAAADHHDGGWLLLCFITCQSPRFLFSTHISVDVFCGCCWPPWLGLAPSVFYWVSVHLLRKTGGIRVLMRTFRPSWNKARGWGERVLCLSLLEQSMSWRHRQENTNQNLWV